MCGRYTLYESQDLEARYGVQGPTVMAEENYNVSPGQYMPVVFTEDGKKKIVSMRWGIVPGWAKDTKIGYKLINARDDTLFQKPMWKGLAKHSRALIPARGFYEWKLDEIGEKQPYFIHPKNKQVFSFAGLYSVWKDVEGLPLYTFTIITTDANNEMRNVHNRMPVILSRDDEDKWLSPELENEAALQEFLHPMADGSLTLYPVSKDVNKPANNNPNLLEIIENSK